LLWLRENDTVHVWDFGISEKPLSCIMCKKKRKAVEILEYKIYGQLFEGPWKIKNYFSVL